MSFHKKSAHREVRLQHDKRLRTNEEQIRILIDNVLLAINMNVSMLSVQTKHDYIGKYILLPNSWQSKNYAFEFVAAINKANADDIFTKVRASSFRTVTLIIDESRGAGVFLPGGTKFKKGHFFC